MNDGVVGISALPRDMLNCIVEIQLKNIGYTWVLKNSSVEYIEPLAIITFRNFCITPSGQTWVLKIERCFLHFYYKRLMIKPTSYVWKIHLNHEMNVLASIFFMTVSLENRVIFPVLEI